MILADLCVRRPVFATMFVGVLVVLGWFSYMRLGVDLFPKVEVPTVMVVTYLPGAAPEEVETLVTKPIEDAVNSVPGLLTVRSTTSRGSAEVSLFFDWSQNMVLQLQLVDAALARVAQSLPSTARI